MNIKDCEKQIQDLYTIVFGLQDQITQLKYKSIYEENSKAQALSTKFPQ